MVAHKSMTSLDAPELAVPDENRIPTNDYLTRTMPIPPSRMFMIKEALEKYKQKAEGHCRKSY